MTYSKDYIDGKLALLAHEIKTPMVLIKYYAEFIKEVNDPKERERFADSIMVLSQEMIDSSQFALTKIKEDQGPFTYVAVPINLHKFCQERVDRFAPMLHHKNQTVDINIPPDLEIKADEIKFKIVVNNLLSNAIKFTPEGGKMSISLNDKALCICDSAHIIDATKRETIFQPYQQGTSSSGRGGFGLGLSNCHDLVSEWGGKIWTQPSDTLSGNTFCFTFPSE